MRTAPSLRQPSLAMLPQSAGRDHPRLAANTCEPLQSLRRSCLQTAWRSQLRRGQDQTRPTVGSAAPVRSAGEAACTSLYGPSSNRESGKPAYTLIRDCVERRRLSWGSTVMLGMISPYRNSRSSGNCRSAQEPFYHLIQHSYHSRGISTALHAESRILVSYR